MISVITRVTIEDIRELVSPADASASVFLGPMAFPPVDAGEDVLLRRRAISTALRGQGADPGTVSAVDDYLRGLTYGADTAVFAAAGEIRQAYPLPGGVRQDSARFAAPAAVLALVGWLRDRPAHVVVRADRIGADVTTMSQGSADGVTRTVTGPDDDIKRSGPGDWSKRRSEDSWLHNAAAVTAAITGELDGVGGRLVILAGDVRACQMLTDRLARTSLRPEVRLVAGGRHPNGSALARQNPMAAALRAHVADQQRLAVERYQAARGTSGSAIAGAEATMAALTQARVATLFLAETALADRQAWFTAGGMCGIGGAEMPTDAIRGRLTDIAIRSALMTHADIQLLGPGEVSDLADGIGAICRYA